MPTLLELLARAPCFILAVQSSGRSYRTLPSDSLDCLLSQLEFPGSSARDIDARALAWGEAGEGGGASKEGSEALGERGE